MDTSIACLDTYIDVLRIYRFDRETPREEIMKALNDIVKRKKARYISTYSVRYPLKLRGHFNNIEIFILIPV